MTIAYDVKQPYSNGRVIGSRWVRVDRRVSRKGDERLEYCCLRAMHDIMAEGGKPVNVVLTYEEHLDLLIQWNRGFIGIPHGQHLCGLPYAVERSL